MKTILVAILSLVLAGCSSPAKFDAENEITVRESIQEIMEDLQEENREEFTKAVVYFSLGGKNGLVSMIGLTLTEQAFEVSPETVVSINLKSIHGLTGEQILEEYRKRLEADAREATERERKAEERETVRNLQETAEELLRSNRFEEALATYEAMSDISLGVEAANIGIEETTKAMEDFTEKMAYIDKVEVTEFVAKRIDTFLEKQIPAVRISLKNTGNRSLDEVKTIVYFQDKYGNTIYEEDFYPVLVSDYSFSSRNKPLKPGYMHEMEQGQYYTLDSQLSEWQEGKAVVKVVDIEFSE